MAVTMKKSHITSVFLLLLLPLLSFSDERQVYVVYFGHHSGGKTADEIEENHYSYLSSIKASEEEARSSLLYSYKNSINGFTAWLTQQEASQLSNREEVLSVIPSHERKYFPHTTRSWEFSGLPVTAPSHSLPKGDLLLAANYGKDVIVGLLDSGIWPESESFNDEGMEPIPKSWKGICQSGDNFNSSHCNKKLIGARYYHKGIKAQGYLTGTGDDISPRDIDGHGTHTSSTVGGRAVPHASALGGYANGTASGGAPQVRLAMYKVCWPSLFGSVCMFEDLLAAFDDAIGDGVDILSISLGESSPSEFTDDALAIGTLHATKHGIVAVLSGGNDGPDPSTVVNAYPWILTVAASSVDRKFAAQVKLGNGASLQGETLTPYKLRKAKQYPLVFAAQVVNNNVSTVLKGKCTKGSLSPKKVKGKIVFCFRGESMRYHKSIEVKRAGGIGYILGNNPEDGNEIEEDIDILPATAVTSEDSIKILKYINSTRNPTAYIYPGSTVLKTKPAPFMADFSSRGPSPVSPYIVKPDVTAPGLDILAAWPEGSPILVGNTTQVVKFNMISGTSMACPHVAAAASLLKAVHPDWSSAAIRSALITSAEILNNQGKVIADEFGESADPFQFGAGHFRPEKAADPGLIYDASYSDYLLYLCAKGISRIDPSFKCPKTRPLSQNLNYPSFAFPNLRGKVTARRTVKNVGGENSMYVARVNSPSGISIKVSPSVLTFSHVGEKKSFELTVEAHRNITKKKGYLFGWLTWSDKVHVVKSPIAASIA